MSKSVCIVIPNRNGIEHLSYSLPSLALTTYPHYKVVMVDDGSTDDSCNYVSSTFPWVHLIKNPYSKGFAGAVNVGIRWALANHYDYIAICNNDIKVLPPWIEPVIERFQVCENDLGAVGYLELTRNQDTPFVMPPELSFSEVGPELPLHLCIFNAEVFASVGLFDEMYFMYGEDSDLFTRMVKAGYRLSQTNIPIWHYGSGFAKQASFRVAWLAYRNAIRFTVKNCSIDKMFRQAGALLFYAVTPKLKHWSKSVLAHFVPHRFIPAVSEIDLLQLEVKMRRLRPGNSITNACIWAAAVVWNILFLPQTLMQRHRDMKRIKKHLNTLPIRS